MPDRRGARGGPSRTPATTPASCPPYLELRSRCLGSRRWRFDGSGFLRACVRKLRDISLGGRRTAGRLQIGPDLPNMENLLAHARTNASIIIPQCRVGPARWCAVGTNSGTFRNGKLLSLFPLPGREHPGWLGRGPVGGPRDRPGAMGKRQKTGKEVDLEGFEKLLGKLEKALSKVLEEAESEGKAEKVRGALFSSHNGLRSVHQLTAFTPLSLSLPPTLHWLARSSPKQRGRASTSLSSSQSPRCTRCFCSARATGRRRTQRRLTRFAWSSRGKTRSWSSWARRRNRRRRTGDSTCLSSK